MYVICCYALWVDGITALLTTYERNIQKLIIDGAILMSGVTIINIGVSGVTSHGLLQFYDAIVQ